MIIAICCGLNLRTWKVFATYLKVFIKVLMQRQIQSLRKVNLIDIPFCRKSIEAFLKWE